MNLFSRTTRWGLILLLCGAITASARPAQELVDAAKRNDVYAVYSAVLSNASVLNQSVFLIAEQTADAGKSPNCAPPFPDYSSNWMEVLSEIPASQVPTKLVPALTLTKPYMLLTPAEAKEFRDSRMPRPPIAAGPTAPPNPKFQGAKDLFTLGNVYFDRGRTIAAVTVTTFAGPLAASATWQLLEKGSDGRWRLAPPWQKSSPAPPCPLLWIA